VNSNRDHICRVKFLPFEISVEVPAGTCILEAVQKAGLPLKAGCGGKGVCGDCVVQVISGDFYQKPAAALPSYLKKQGYALACQTPINNKLTINLPRFQEMSIKSITESEYFHKHRDDISGLDIKPASKKKRSYGLACDIGTSTVAIHVVELKSGKIVGTAGGFNQQIKCGEDVISRIEYARKPGCLLELHQLIIKTINLLLKKALEGTTITASEIHYMVVSGNPTMIHLFLESDPTNIRHEPYVPIFKQAPAPGSQDLGLDIHPEGRVFYAPDVGSYVGGDITAGLLCTPVLRETDKISLFIDAGTNGELVIGNKDWLMTCACSIGPAFEGNGTSCGMPALPGAIEKIAIDPENNIEYRVIGGTKPKGVCGSGLVDLLAEMFFQGYINRQGKFTNNIKQEKIVEFEDTKGFLIEREENSFWGKDLYITENDISHLIRSKAAVFSACSLLLKHLGIDFSKIHAVYIAGGFGHYLNLRNAIRIGLLPDLDEERFNYIGNSSLFGAYLILLNEANRDMVQKLAKKMTYIELNTEPGYMFEYMGALFLPHTDLQLFPSVEKILNRPL